MDHRHVLRVGTARQVSSTNDDRTIEVDLHTAALKDHPHLEKLQEEKLLKQLAALDPQSLGYMSRISTTAEVSGMLEDAAQALEEGEGFGLKLLKLKTKTGFEKMNFTVGGVPINMLESDKAPQIFNQDEQGELSLTVGDRTLKLSGIDPTCYYSVSGDIFNPEGPTLEKKEVNSADTLNMSHEEQAQARTQASTLIRKATNSYCRDGRFDELAGIPIDEWEESLNRNTREVIHATIDANHPPQEQELHEKYRDYTFREFMSEDSKKNPIKDIFVNMGDDAVGDRLQDAQMMLGARMYGEVQAMVLQDLLGVDREERNQITDEFIDRAVRRIGQSPL